VEDKLLLKNGDEIKHQHGPVLDVRPIKDKPDCIKVSSSQKGWKMVWEWEEWCDKCKNLGSNDMNGTSII